MPGGEATGRCPVAELHRHFEAGLRPETIARLAERHHVEQAHTRSGRRLEGLDPQDPESIRRYYREVAASFDGPDGFSRFVDSFGLPLSVLQTTGDLEEAVLEELLDCAAAGSLHTELRGSPFTYAERIAAPIDEIADALARGVRRAWDEHRVSGTFILAFSRQKGLGAADGPPAARQAPAVARVAARLHDPDHPVGIDVAGFPELTYPPRMFREALRPAREARVPLTVHCGEQGLPPRFDAAPAGLIVEAIEELGARRIGHGTSLAASAAARTLAREAGVGIECCPWSNDRLGFMPAARHPLPLFLEEGLLVSLGTDDPLMFGLFGVRETFDAIAAGLGLDERVLERMTRHAVETAFVSEARRKWLRDRLGGKKATGD
jgi:adenosine deaminase